MRYFLFTIVFFVGLSFALPGVVVGQTTSTGASQFTILNPTSSITAGSPVTDAAGSPVDFIQTIFNVYKYAQLVAVALAAIMITLGGINIAVSGAVDRQAEGKDMIKSAIFGLVLLFGANLILRTINPALTSLRLSSPNDLPPSLLPHCEQGLDPAKAQENKCLPECTEDQVKSGEHRKTSPVCYVPIPLCDADLMASCQGIFVFGEEVVLGDTSELSSRIATLDEQRSKAFESCRTTYFKERCLEESGYYRFANESTALRAQMRGVPVFPQCKTSRDCENGIGSHTMSLSGSQLKEGARYSIYPFYPRNKGVEEARCLTIFFEDLEHSSDEKTKWEMSQRRGLKKCPIDPFSYAPVSAGKTGSALEDRAGGGTPGGGGEVIRPSQSRPPEVGCLNCEDINRRKVGLKVEGRPGMSGVGCWTYPDQNVKRCQLNADLLAKIYSLASQRGLVSWIITEAWPPTVPHSSDCHFNGTCADIAITEDSNCNDVANLVRAAEGLGIKVLNEYPQCPGGRRYDQGVGSGHLHLAL